MLKVLKNGFYPISSDLCGFSGDTDQITTEAETIANSLEQQVFSTRTVVISAEYVRTDPQIAALAELTITELAHLQRLGDIGCFLASAYSVEENIATQQPPPPECVRIASSLLVASGKIRQEIVDVCHKLTILSPILAATLSTDLSLTLQQQYHRKLVATLFTRFGGGGSSIEVRLPVPLNDIFEQICRISESVWILMTVYSMIDAFRFIEDHKSMTIDPNDSIFGNNGWRVIQQAATWPSGSGDAGVEETELATSTSSI
jgi:hypothetical protein